MNEEFYNSQSTFESEIEEIVDSGNTSSDNYYDEEEVTLTDEYRSQDSPHSDDYYEESYHSSPEGRQGSRRESIAVPSQGYSSLDDLGESFLNGSFIEDVFEEDTREDDYSVPSMTSNDILSEDETSYDDVSRSEVGRSAKYDADVDGSSHHSSSASSYSAEIKDDSNRRWYQPPKQTPPRRIKTEEGSLGISSTSFRSSSYSKVGDSSISSLPQAPVAMASVLGTSASSLGSMRTITEHEGSHRSEASEMLSRGGTDPHNRGSPKTTNRRGKKSQKVSTDNDTSAPSYDYTSDDRSRDIQPSMASASAYTRQTDSRASTYTRQTDSYASNQSPRSQQRPKERQHQREQYETTPMSPTSASSYSTNRISVSEDEGRSHDMSPSITSTRMPSPESYERQKPPRPQRNRPPKTRPISPTPSTSSRSTNGPPIRDNKNCASIAVLGTMSGTGKGIVAAALCRIFANGGTKCAPFKSQNTGAGTSPALLPELARRDAMYKTLDFMVKRQGYKNGTKNGHASPMLVAPTNEQGYGQIGAAQSLQAEACRILPRVEMNPIFFKSRGANEKNEAMCDMVVMGKQVVRESYGNLSKMVPTMNKMVLGSHRSLAAVTGADVIVVQGAGACSEIHLMDGDIVNLPLVRSLKCPWLLVANDDAGGVFAQVVGTKMCVSKRDWDACVGIIINKVRGDPNQLPKGLKMLEKMTGKPLYAMPFVEDLHPASGEAIDIERRIAWERKGRKESGRPTNKPSVVVVACPHSTISNELYPLEKDTRFHVEYRRKRLPKPYPATTAVILPGSRLPLLDLKWLRDSGWAEFIRKHVSAGGTVLGLGAGYQMLGWEVKQGTHSKQGIGLLPISSIAKPAECNLKEPVRGQIYPSGVSVEGFELICGHSEIVSSEKKNVASGRYEGMAPLLAFENGKPEGMKLDRVHGTYLHGILRSAKARVELLTSSSDRTQFQLEDFTNIVDPLDKLANHLQNCGLDDRTLRKIVFA